MAAPDTGAPPPAPDVQSQQGPMAAYAQGGGQSGKAAMQDPKASMAFAQQKLGSISNDLLELAKVLAVEKPALMPVLKKMAQAGKVLEQMMSQETQGQGSAQASQGAEPPQGSQSAPEAPAAMGA